METAKRSLSIALIVLASVIFVVMALDLPAGPLDPPAAPSPTMHTLDDIYANTAGVIVPPEAAARPRGPSYLSVAGIPGECDADHKDWIDIFGYDFEVSVPDTTYYSSGRDPSQWSKFRYVNVIKEVDKASPLLMLKCAQGQTIPSVIIESTQPGNTGQSPVYMRLQLTNVVISRIAPRLVYRGDSYVHMEEVSLYYEKIEWRYDVIAPDGTKVETVQEGWNLKFNQKV
jgi:type VI secretion system secreted protein Hcp